MPTYHVFAVPKLGESPNPLTCPLLPMDLTAESEDAAIAQGEIVIAEDARHFWEDVLDGTPGPAGHPGMQLGEESAPVLSASYADHWLVVARQVDRSPVEVRRVSVAADAARAGMVIDTHHDESDAIGQQGFDVFIGGVICGQLRLRVSEMPPAMTWHIANPEGPLITLAEQRWPDERESRTGFAEWPHSAIADIRAALEADRVVLTTG